MQSGGPSWGVLLGRLDSKTSDFNGSLNLPAPTDNLTILQQKFSNLSLNDVDLVALSVIEFVGALDGPDAFMTSLHSRQVSWWCHAFSDSIATPDFKTQTGQIHH
ncbi:unnamed protein product [Miscanthus lutarioriparius]|uniref:Plant heme peroxidase family profile domain-containing protein n=1 Tax=Miscanthus lutarioriparius TaxID=422564 RepID=A0A811MTP2_9POAL|nr:unnamed protein product [Miscanthus lutarioriparius]